MGTYKRDYVTGAVQATSTSYVTLITYPIPSNTIVGFKLYAIAQEPADLTRGSGNAYCAAFRNNAGTITQIGSTTNNVSQRSDNGYICQFTISGTDVLVECRSKSSVNLNWKGFLLADCHTI